VIIRKVNQADRARWIVMRAELWPDEPSSHPVEVDRYFSGDSMQPQSVVVAEQDGDLIGFAEFSVRYHAEGCTGTRVGYLEGWYVDEDQRRRGVGRALLRSGERWAAGHGCTEFGSDAEPDNETSHAAHKALGFRDVGLVRCFAKKLDAEPETDV
jgi:aminoglycoside 6'-N-acetyltransferase I